MCQEFSHFSAVLHNSVLAKFKASNSIRVKEQMHHKNNDTAGA